MTHHRRVKRKHDHGIETISSAEEGHARKVISRRTLSVLIGLSLRRSDQSDAFVGACASVCNRQQSQSSSGHTNIRRFDNKAEQKQKKSNQTRTHKNIRAGRAGFAFNCKQSGQGRGSPVCQQECRIESEQPVRHSYRRCFECAVVCSE